MSGATQPAAIIRTKLNRPPVPSDFVPRSRLQTILDDFNAHALTLISAAAGYGKSTLVSSWLQDLDAKNVWISLDEHENNLQQFLQYIVAAVQTIFPQAMAETSALVNLPNLPPVAAIAGTLINELDKLEEPLVIVLDDFHYIHDQSVLELFATFLNYPVPNLYWVLVGRRDPFLPIARLRAQNQLNEIRAEGLRFTAIETQRFLQNVLRQDLDAEVASKWLQQTEGWITGLRLAALAFRGKDNSLQNPLKSLKSQRYTIQYLLQEVLERQPPAVRTQLLQSALANRFCESLCDRLHDIAQSVDRPSLNGHDFIAWLEATQLFIIPLDTEHDCFRYHHFFQHLLREEAKHRYGQEAITTLHLEISQWFEEQGSIDEALDHALVAELEYAASIVERYARSMLNNGKWYIVTKWLTRLPDTVIQKRPELLLAKAWQHYYTLNYAAVPTILDSIDQQLSSDGSEHALTGEVSMFRGFWAFLKGEGATSLDYLEAVVDHIAITDVQYRALGELLFGLAGQMEGQQHRVTKLLKSYLQEPRLHPLRQTNLLQALMLINYIAGDPITARHYLQSGRQAAASGSLENLMAWNDNLEGLFHLQWGEFELAIQHLYAGSTRKYLHHARGATDTLAALAIAYQLHGQTQLANDTLQTLKDFTSSLLPPFQAIAASCAARVALLQGDLKVAISWLDSTPQPQAEVMLWWFEIPCITYCRILIATGLKENLQTALEALQAYAQQNEAHHNTCQLVGIYALQAVAAQQLGKTRFASLALGQALTLAQPGHLLFPFLELGVPMADLLKAQLHGQKDQADFSKQILTAYLQLHETQATAKLTLEKFKSGQNLIEPLTPCELNVLELLDQGLYQKEIANHLFVSHETVKTHLKHIYQKLAVHDRRSAVQKAKALDLLAVSRVS